MKKKILAVCLAAAACVLLSTTIQTKSMQRNMAQKVLRFHVLANSDSREDQALKLKVRDQVGTLMAEKLKDADSLEESERIVKANLNLIENCAADVISAEGYAYPVSAALENCNFPEKTYGTYTFPGDTCPCASASGRRRDTTGGASCIRISALPTVCMRWMQDPGKNCGKCWIRRSMLLFCRREIIRCVSNYSIC